MLASEDAMFAFLNAYWLRPEHAIWFYYDATEFQRNIRFFGNRSVDVGCGDGVTSFLFNGGRFGLDFDVHRSVDETVSYIFDRKHDDYYDKFDPSQFQEIPIIRRPDRGYEYGLDYKDGLVKKATALGLYRNVASEDFNKGISFAAGRFDYIFSNTIYHAREVDAHLKDLHRVLASGGYAQIYCPNSNFANFALYRFVPKYGWDWIEHHDRGRYRVWEKSADDIPGWSSRFKRAGFVVEDAKAYLPNFVTMIEDVGLRAIFPSLLKMANKIREHSKEDYLGIKRHWMENLFFLLEPFKDTAWLAKAGPVQYVWNSFILRRP